MNAVLAAESPAGLEPIYVSDVRDDGYWYGAADDRPYFDTLRAWMRDQGVEPNDTYRLEVYLLDVPFVKVHAYARDEDGDFRFGCRDEAGHHAHDGQCQLVKLDPYVVILSSLPPERVSGSAGMAPSRS
ncbi:MAG: hypothetical protein ABR585_07440 [Gemmatimonadaceae bacterium]